MPRTALACLLALLAACASAKSVNMVPTGIVVDKQLAGSVQLFASGTPKRLGIGAARVSGAQLAEALRAAVFEAGLFQSVVEERADYRLEVRVDELSSPPAGLDMRVDATLFWSLKSHGGERTVFEAPIKTGYTAGPDDAFDVKERERFAIERALQENLREGISRLAQLDLPSR
jgi:hypothetical protein